MWFKKLRNLIIFGKIILRNTLGGSMLPSVIHEQLRYSSLLRVQARAWSEYKSQQKAKCRLVWPIIRWELDIDGTMTDSGKPISWSSWVESICANTRLVGWRTRSSQRLCELSAVVLQKLHEQENGNSDYIFHWVVEKCVKFVETTKLVKWKMDHAR